MRRIRQLFRRSRYNWPDFIRGLGALIGSAELIGKFLGYKPDGSLLAFAGTCILIKNLVGVQERRNDRRNGDPPDPPLPPAPAQRADLESVQENVALEEEQSQ